MALWRIRATVDDRPGYLSVLTASLALKAVNILAVQVHTTEAGAVDDFLVDAPDALTEADLLAAIGRGRGRDAFVCRAEAEGLADQPTRALALAGRLVRDPDTLGEALVVLLDAAEVRWRPEPLPGRPGYTDDRMALADPAGGYYEVLRARPSFTPAEYARARALTELAGATVRQQQEQTTLLLTDGNELTVRTATPDDAESVAGLHRRASTASLQSRYLGGSAPSKAKLRRLLDPAGGRTLLAVAADGKVVAMASLFAEGDLGEIAVLIEDDWQRRGIGTALVRRLQAWAEKGRFAALVAHTAADNVAMLRTLRRLGAGPAERDGSLVSVTLPVSGRIDTPAESLKR
ncbi:GNAT family N-acetyltransferase [Actinoplanes sp. KI2]|uniref:GNAT family N-acetyltransferase n=1 Tax=Actinoplanes sp. KI2 TaxID=2983315 RepID=UPI0021D5B211|nr:GNAT family N-acetyltransferase [Actinoplanes sp. KI2]MCU7725885.1 GNAT family N-acetyltransferase [Actinoplanes sp. KI2]